MRYMLFLFMTLVSLAAFSQEKDSLRRQSFVATHRTSFIARIDTLFATKDGIYLNGYVVNLSYKKIRKLSGKRVRIAGKVTMVKAVKNLPGADIAQGREEDTRHILSPKVEVLNEQ